MKDVRGSFGKVGCDDGVVVEEEADSDNGQDEVYSRAQSGGFEESVVESG